MPKPKGAGELRQRVRFERRAEQGDGYGNVRAGWVPLGIERQAALHPTRGGEEIQAGRLAGVASWDLWLRWDRRLATVVADECRAVNVRTGQAFNIRFVGDLDGDQRWLFMQLQSGVPEG